VNTIDSPLFGLSQRLPPSNVQAEQALLGALLANNKAYERVSEFLAPEHFADPIHGRIYQAISRRVEAGQLADAVTLKAEFGYAAGILKVGGTACLTQLLTAMSRHHQRQAITGRRFSTLDAPPVDRHRRNGRQQRLGADELDEKSRSGPPSNHCSTWPLTTAPAAGSSPSSGR
jgi:hypothetical protein